MTEQMKSKIEAECGESCHPATFEAAIHWYLDNLWHDAAEIAKDNTLFLAEWQLNEDKGLSYSVFLFPYDVFPKLAFSWFDFVKEYNVKRWAYIDDLLPATLQDDK